MTDDPKYPKMVKTLILLPVTLRTELEAIRARDGMSLSQQCRLSLTLWVKAVSKHPLGANSLHGAAVAKAHKLGGWGPGQPVPQAPEPTELGPEPDQHENPAAWAKWAAKDADATIAKLAKGEWPD